MSDDALKETATDQAEPSGREFQPLIDDLYREEILDARRMSIEDKLLLGERLFRWACEITLAGISSQNPGASEVECQKLLRERIALGKKLGTL